METIIQKAWTGSKWLIKGGIIALIALLLKIPAYYVEDLIKEREQRQEAAIAEVSDKWAGNQSITGPILVLPYRSFTDSSQKKSSRQLAYFLPDELKIRSGLVPAERHRGIYKVMLYSADIKLNGSFSEVDVTKINLDPGQVIWEEAFVRMSISDTRGLNDELKMDWAGKELVFSNQVSDMGEDILVAQLPLTGPQEIKNLQFASEFNVNGSGKLLFTPLGKATSVELNSKWPHPSFTGQLLPQTSDVSDSGFTATWKSHSHKRKFPQQWTGESSILRQFHPAVSVSGPNVHTSSFGAELFIPVNGYQKSMRSIKYAILCILLTFAAFFLIELNHKASVHPFQYGLIGIALILFYTLLLSFSEYTGFNIAYLIASFFTIGLIGWFVKGLMKSSKITMLMSGILMLLYIYIFTILQMQDFSLLLGSLGLFAALAVIMHFSKKIQW